MIDTDQYEGHTPTEEWDDIVYADNHLSIFLNDATIMATDLDRRLMAAAPLLLAEVKSWHKVRDYILERASYPTVKKLHLKDLLNFMEEVIE